MKCKSGGSSVGGSTCGIEGGARRYVAYFGARCREAIALLACALLLSGAYSSRPCCPGLERISRFGASVYECEGREGEDRTRVIAVLDSNPPGYEGKAEAALFMFQEGKARPASTLLFAERGVAKAINVGDRTADGTDELLLAGDGCVMVDGGSGAKIFDLAAAFEGSDPGEGRELGWRSWNAQLLSDVNGDGHRDAVLTSVTANGSRARVALVSLDPPTLLFERFERVDGSLFGRAITTGQDLDEDGVADILVAQPLSEYDVDEAGEGARGQVIAYSGANGDCIMRLFAPDVASAWGTSIAMLADLDGDRCGELAVGSPCEVSGKKGLGCTGSVYLLSGKTGECIRRVGCPGEEALHTGGCGFGASLAVVCARGESHERMLVGAPEESLCDGAAYLLSLGSESEPLAVFRGSAHEGMGRDVGFLPGLGSGGTIYVVSLRPMTDPDIGRVHLIPWGDQRVGLTLTTVPQRKR